jgi:SAM-dependent MidA family methyltransferase
MASGPMPFEAFMAEALYGLGGFYTSGGRAGRRGDFLTSPEVGPLFGAVIARFLDAEWRRLGRPDTLVVHEVGAGPGTLARTVLAAEPDCRDALDYVAVELSESQRASHPEGIRSRGELPDGRLEGVVLMNELLDNLPFRLAVHDGAWREAFVDAQGDEVLSAPFDPVPAVLPADAALGARAPLVDRAATFLSDTIERLNGVLVAIDYFAPTTAGLASRPWREWLRTYAGHERGRHYLGEPGAQDITCEVPLDQLPEPEALRTQSQWLELHGITELVDEGRRFWEEHASAPDLTALRMRSRISEAEALTDPSGLGAFLVAEWRGRA